MSAFEFVHKCVLCLAGIDAVNNNHLTDIYKGRCLFEWGVLMVPVSLFIRILPSNDTQIIFKIWVNGFNSPFSIG